MEYFLFRASTKRTDGWSQKTPRPLYVVAHDKQAAIELANNQLAEGLSISHVSRLAKQMAPHVFSGNV